MKRFATMLLMVAALLLGQVALAKGSPQQVTLSGDGFALTLTGDQATLDALAFMTLEDYSTATADPPADLSGDGCLITRSYLAEHGEMVAFDQLRYYPDPAGGRGYLYYVGIVYGTSDSDHLWFRANPQSETILKALIADARRSTALTNRALLSIFLNAAALLGGN